MERLKDTVVEDNHVIQVVGEDRVVDSTRGYHGEWIDETVEDNHTLELDPHVVEANGREIRGSDQIFDTTQGRECVRKVEDAFRAGRAEFAYVDIGEVVVESGNCRVTFGNP